jgi:hypothetical protein
MVMSVIGSPKTEMPAAKDSLVIFPVVVHFLKKTPHIGGTGAYTPMFLTASYQTSGSISPLFVRSREEKMLERSLLV